MSNQQQYLNPDTRHVTLVVSPEAVRNIFNMVSRASSVRDECMLAHMDEEWSDADETDADKAELEAWRTLAISLAHVIGLGGIVHAEDKLNLNGWNDSIAYGMIGQEKRQREAPYATTGPVVWSVHS